MPLHEYQCADCGRVSEVLVSARQIREGEIPPCEYCGGQKMTRLFSAPAAPADTSPACPARDMGLCGGSPPPGHGGGCARYGCGG